MAALIFAMAIMFVIGMSLLLGTSNVPKYQRKHVRGLQWVGIWFVFLAVCLFVVGMIAKGNGHG